MNKSEDFKIRLIFPCEFEYYAPHAVASRKNLPYGMAVLTAFLRQNNYYVEQEDLSARLNNFNKGTAYLACKFFKNFASK